MNCDSQQQTKCPQPPLVDPLRLTAWHTHVSNSRDFMAEHPPAADASCRLRGVPADVDNYL